VRTIGALWGIETVILRVFNAYGPGQHLPPVHAPVIPAFLRQAFLNGTIVVHGDGAQTRDYIYLDDIVDAMLAAAAEPEANGHILNIGSGIETSLRDLTRLAVDTTGGSPEVIYNPRNEGGVKRMCAGIDLSRRILHFQPTISLAEGLRRTFEQDIRQLQKAS
jgi:UDP-glucose 4-epimerase